MHHDSCKAEPPSEATVMANVLKERQYAVHEALERAVGEAKETYERMKVRLIVWCMLWGVRSIPQWIDRPAD